MKKNTGKAIMPAPDRRLTTCSNKDFSHHSPVGVIKVRYKYILFMSSQFNWIHLQEVSLAQAKSGFVITLMISESLK